MRMCPSINLGDFGEGGAAAPCLPFKPCSEHWDLFLLLGKAGGERTALPRSVFPIKRRKSSKTHSGLNIPVKKHLSCSSLAKYPRFLWVIAGRWFLFLLKMSNSSSPRIPSETKSAQTCESNVPFKPLSASPAHPTILLPEHSEGALGRELGSSHCHKLRDSLVPAAFREIQPGAPGGG